LVIKVKHGQGEIGRKKKKKGKKEKKNRGHYPERSPHTKDGRNSTTTGEGEARRKCQTDLSLRVLCVIPRGKPAHEGEKGKNGGFPGGVG